MRSLVAPQIARLALRNILKTLLRQRRAEAFSQDSSPGEAISIICEGSQLLGREVAILTITRESPHSFWIGDESLRLLANTRIVTRCYQLL
jgi:hypothetical protein